MAGGFAKDGAVQDQIDASLEDEVKRARSQLPQGESAFDCDDCGTTIPEARRKAIPGVTHDNRILDVADRILHLEDGHMKSLTEAVSEGTSRMLNLLGKHEPNSASYLASFSFALARVAYADNQVTVSELAEMRRILHDVANLQPAEVEFIMELAMMQKRAQSESASNSDTGLGAGMAEQFVESLYAIARADGTVSPEEVNEIEAIAAEFGIHQSR